MCVCVCECVPILCGLITIQAKGTSKSSCPAFQFLYMTLADDKINKFDLSNIVIMNKEGKGDMVQATEIGNLNSLCTAALFPNSNC